MPILMTAPPVIFGGASHAVLSLARPRGFDLNFPLGSPETGLFITLAILVWLASSSLIALVTVSERHTIFHSALVTYPLVTVALTGLFIAPSLLADKNYLGMDLNNLLPIWPASAVLSISALVAMTAACLLRTVLIGLPHTPQIIVLAVVSSVGITALVLIPATAATFHISLPFVQAFFLAPPATVLIHTINPRIRTVLLASTGLWVLLLEMRWYWMYTMDAGLG
jgi:hypothetical protein